MALVASLFILLSLLSQCTEAKVVSMNLNAQDSQSSSTSTNIGGFRAAAATQPSSAPQPGQLHSRDMQRYHSLWDRAAQNADSKSNSSEGSLLSLQNNAVGGSSIDTTNNVVFYSVEIGVGRDGKKHSILVDTGSSNTWIGARDDYRQTSTSEDLDKSFAVKYGSGQVEGELYSDRVTIGNLAIEDQMIGVAQASVGFAEQTDGILGLGPTDLSRGSVKDSSEAVPTVVDELFDQGEIDNLFVGVFFAPTESLQSTNGMLSFGGMDPSLIQGRTITAQRTETSPSNVYWGVDMSFALGDKEFGARTAGIVDTGTTLVMLADDYFLSYTSALEEFGAEMDQMTGLVRVPADEVQNIPDLNFRLDDNDQPLALIADAQFFPQSVTMNLGVTAEDASNYRYSVVSTLGSESGNGMDFIWGMKALERYATGFDSENQSISFGVTRYTTRHYDHLDLGQQAFDSQAAGMTAAAGFSSVADDDGESSSAGQLGRWRVAELAALIWLAQVVSDRI